MSKDPIADCLKSTLAIITLMEKGARAIEKNNREILKQTQKRKLKQSTLQHKEQKPIEISNRTAVYIFVIFLLILIFGTISSL